MKSKNMLATNPVKESRETNDYYATHPDALKIFLNKLNEDNLTLSKDIWECAVGGGHLAKVLIEKGFNVRCTDIVYRGFPKTEIKDFLSETEIWNGDILTNPPFILAEQFVEKGMSLLEKGKKLILFLKVQFLESKRRKLLFEKYPPKYIYLNSERQHTAKNGDFGKYTLGTLFFCWFVWEKGFKGEPIIRWI